MYKQRALSILTIVVVILSTAIFTVSAETKNTYSSYSIYGIGKMQSQGTLATRSMGGAGVGLRTMSSINLLNPAAYSITLPKSVLFDFGLEGATYTEEQVVKGSNESGRFSTFNFHDIALQIPIAKGLGVAFSLSPYSSVGYSSDSESWLKSDEGEPIAKVITSINGSGEVTEVKLGAGWEIIDGLSIGLAAQYYWGSIDRSVTQDIYAILNPSSVSSPYINDEYSISTIKGQVGVQWSAINESRKKLTFGATYDMGGDLNPRHVRTVSGSSSVSAISQIDTTHLSLVKPNQLSIGVSYQNEKLIAAFDYSRQNWDNKDSTPEYSIKGIEIGYNNINVFKAGLEYIPKRGDIRSYYKRIAYRAGFRHSGHYLTYDGISLNEYAITAGAGFPINMVGISKIDLGFEWGTMGTTDYISGSDIGLVKERFFKFSVGVTMFGNDYWFQRPMID